eukprot:7065763-Pyramimonas_sp.AAC.1
MFSRRTNQTQEAWVYWNTFYGTTSGFTRSSGFGPPEPGGLTSRERGRAKRIAIHDLVALLFPTLSYIEFHVSHVSYVRFHPGCCVRPCRYRHRRTRKTKSYMCNTRVMFSSRTRSSTARTCSSCRLRKSSAELAPPDWLPRSSLHCPPPPTSAAHMLDMSSVPSNPR